MRSYRLNAVIIKRRNFLEKDRILTLFSLEQGKTEALAKGARRPGNRLSANSDIAVAANFNIYRTKSIDIITEINPFFRPDGIRGQFDKTQTASYALKIIDKFYEQEESHPKTYYNLLCLIESISDSARQLIFLKFLLDVLDDLGALPNFVNCPVCHKQISSEDEFKFAFQGGLTHQHCLEGECISIGEREIKLLRLLARINLPEAMNLKVDKKTFHNTYLIIQRYFESEFGNILPDKVM